MSRLYHDRERSPRALIACIALLVVGSACQPQIPPPPATPTSPPPSPAPIAAASPIPSPSPGLAALASPVASPSPSPAALPSPSPSPEEVALDEPLVLDKYAFAVMIDNIAEARPHYGLNAADVVYEAPAEAGIPRLMPVFLREGSDVARIGPVRSTRHYFVFLADEFTAPLVHIGSSPQASSALAQTGLPHLDETRGDGGFFRDRSLRAPHNAFVTPAAVRAELARKGVDVPITTGGLSFGAFEPGPEQAHHVSIPYPGPDHYAVAYDYDPQSAMYPRIMDGQPHRDGTSGEQYAARSIMIQFANVIPIAGDTAGRVDVTLFGSGKGILIAGGSQVPLQWNRASPRENTHFRREDGLPFSLPNGQVWFQVVPLDTRVSIS